MDKKKPETRTEDEKVMQAGIKVILGGNEYAIAPLVIRDSGEWRKKVGPWKAGLAKLASVDSDDPEKFEAALTNLMVGRIDETIDFFFDYARKLIGGADIEPDKIKAIASDTEVVAAFNKVFEYAFPLG